MNKDYFPQFNKEQIDFIIQNYPNLGNGVEEFTEIFNRKFGTNYTTNQMKSKASKLKIKRQQVKRTSFGNGKFEWLRDNYKKYETWSELSKAFNNHFGTDYKRNNIQRVCSLSFSERKPQGNIDSKGRFKKGERNLNGVHYHKIGEEAIFNGFTYVKVCDDLCDKNNSNKAFNKNWKLKQRYVWEKAHNDVVKKGEVVIFLDGDRNNFDIDNLLKVNRAELVRINQYGVAGNKELTLTLLDVYRAKSCIKEIETISTSNHSEIIVKQ